MSVFDPIDPKLKEEKKPTIEEIYGYEEEMPEEEEKNENFLDKMINDLKTKEQKAFAQQKDVTGSRPA